jgi:hypothetical protein
MGYPSTKEFIWIIVHKLLDTCPEKEDVIAAEGVFGTDADGKDYV